MSNSKNACADQSSCHNKLDQTRFVLTETASGEAAAETHSQDNNDNCTTLVHGRADGCDIDGMDAQVSDELSGGSNTVDVKDEANTVSLQQQQEFELPAFDNVKNDSAHRFSYVIMCYLHDVVYTVRL